MPKAVKTKAGAGTAKGADGNKVAPKRNKLYAMPEKIAEGTILTDVTKSQWRIGASIGIGGFGEIYSACRVGETNFDYVVKCEPHDNGPLFVEMHFYSRNARLEKIQCFQNDRGLKSLGMPHMIGNGSVDINGQKHRFIVMPRYGSDIAKHLLENGNRLPEVTIYRLALQMLNVYEFIHSCGYVHADLKASNILLGYGEGGEAQAYLLDFGLASHFTTKEFKPDPKKMHNGTIDFTSRDAHKGVPTMRGDLEILGYNLINWFGVQLPWVAKNILAAPAKVQKEKDEFMSGVETNLKFLFPKGVPVPIAEFMVNVTKMEYNEKPDYDNFRQIFSGELEKMKASNDGNLEFKTKAYNNATIATSKTGAKDRTKSADLVFSAAEPCVSDDDKPIKKAPQKVVKTRSKPKVVNVSPKQKKSARLAGMPKLSPLSNKSFSPPARKPVTSLQRKRRSVSVSPVQSRYSPRIKNKIMSTMYDTPILESGLPLTPKSLQSTPLSSKPGRTIVNDNTTPNPRSGKTYEFDFELDVSIDANVVVNVKRKKKSNASISTNGTDSVERGSSMVNGLSKRTAESGGDDNGFPVARVKARKLTADDDNDNPPTVALTMRKTTRAVQ